MTKRNLFNRVLFLIFLLITMGCTSVYEILNPDVTPQYGNEIGVEQEKMILFSDDFTGASSWHQLSNALGSKITLEHQGLRISVNMADYDYWTTPGKSFNNVIVAVDGSKLGGPDNNVFGVICRYQSSEKFYAFLISSDGYYGVLKVKEGNYLLLSGPNMAYSEHIIQGRGTNRIRADCSGWSLSLFVNGVQLVNVSDLEYLYGDVGLIAGTEEEPGVDILFDNFVVYAP
jgi:hypothetical protein